MALRPADTANLIRYGMEWADIVVSRAAGSHVYDAKGRAILDFTSGQMCATLGHNHPQIVAAIEAACRGSLHLFSGLLSPAVIELSHELAALLPDSLTKLLFLNTGSEVNEAALRMAKLHTGCHEVVGFTGSWHGMSAGASSSTYAAGRRGYGPSMPGVLALPAPNCFRCPIRHCRDHCDTTCLDVGFEMIDSQSTGAIAAVLAEPVQSSGGVVVPPPGYFSKLREKCDERGALLILDEAQTAFGRLGTNFAFETLDIVPDILTLSKTLGGGLPMAATATGEKIEADCHAKGFMHITSHVSDPLPAEVARAVLRVLAADHLNERAITMGAYLHAGLQALQQRYEAVGDIRGYGLLYGVDLVIDRDSRRPDPELGAAVTRRCMELGLSMNIVSVGGLAAVWRIAPPLTVSHEEIDLGLTILDQAMGECLAA
jgi:2,2-dialkylglycine decarboxylase (pyruvate)